MIRNATQHNMERRSHAHDYRRPGIYHITLEAASGQPFGTLTGNPDVPDGHPDAPRIVLSPVGAAVERELLYAISSHYPMVHIDTYTIMPDHLHFLAVVTAPLVNGSGKSMHLGMVIKGFKYGCNRSYWQLLGLQTGHREETGRAEACRAEAGRATESPGTVCQPTRSAGGYPPLFKEGYCDVMPVDAEQLERQRVYIRDNARSRLLRMAHRDWLTTRRGGVATALTVRALMGYLRRECTSSQATPEAFAAIAGQLLTRGRATESPGTVVVCDSYGDRGLLERRLLPVVCHRRDKGRFAEQKCRCLEEAAKGAVLVSGRIAKGEQEIIDTAIGQGRAVVLVEENGFPERYHPSAERLRLCAEGRLLLVSPWRYEYRGRDGAVTEQLCKTMNAVAQALCRLGDGWWR